MSLVKCPECGKNNVSDTATSCPRCGFNVKVYYEEHPVPPKSEFEVDYENKEKKSYNVVIGICISVFLFVVIFSVINHANSTADFKKNTEQLKKAYNEMDSLNDTYSDYLRHEEELSNCNEDNEKYKYIKSSYRLSKEAVSVNTNEVMRLYYDLSDDNKKKFLKYIEDHDRYQLLTSFCRREKKIEDSK